MTILIIILVVVGFFVLGHFAAKDHEKKKNELDAHKAAVLSRVPNLVKSDHYQNYVGRSFGIDNTNRNLFIYDQLNYSLVPYASIVSAEIVEDGDTIAQTSTSSAVGRAIVGGVLTGGVGAIVGGATAKKKTISKVRRLEIKVKTNNIDTPSHSLLLFESPKLIDRSEGYNKILATAERWVDIFDAIIASNKKEEPQLIQVESSNSVADELLKLSGLKEKGFLTESEFETQKARLLS